MQNKRSHIGLYSVRIYGNVSVVILIIRHKSPIKCIIATFSMFIWNVTSTYFSILTLRSVILYYCGDEVTKLFPGSCSNHR